jgi:hypothetical protein
MKRRPRRGEFRSIATVLLDGPDYRRLTPEARHTFLACKLSLGPCQIGVVPAMAAVLGERTGYDPGQVEVALAELESEKWIEREANVLWVVGGLQHDPSLDVENDRHVKGVRAFVDGLPRLPIVERFKSKYGNWFDGVTPAVVNGIEKPTDSPGIAYPVPIEDTEDEDRRPKTDNRRPKTKTEEGVAAALNPLGRVAFEGLLRASQNPTALAAEIHALLTGLRGPCTAEQVSQALHDLTVSGITRPTARQLRGFVRRAGEEPAGGSTTRGPRDEFSALKAKLEEAGL